MTDQYGDTWSNNYFVGFGLRETITKNDNGGKSKRVNFNTTCGAAPAANTSAPATASASTQVVTVGGGRYFGEIRWKITCDDIMIVSETEGRAPYNKSVTLPVCTSCNLALRDTYGDNWSGNFFTGFGLNETVTSSDNRGRSKSIDFTSPGCSSNSTTVTPSKNETVATPDSSAPAVANSTEGLVRSNVTVGGGTYKSEIRWNITCAVPAMPEHRGHSMKVPEEEGRAPYAKVVVLPACTNCRLNMRDTYSDTWSGNYFVGYGLNETITRNDNGGRSKAVNFTTEGCPPEPEEDDDDDVELDDEDDEEPTRLDRNSTRGEGRGNSSRKNRMDDDDDEPSEDTWMQGDTSFYMAAYYNKETDYYFPGAEINTDFNFKKGALHTSASLLVMVVTTLSLLQ